MPIIIVIIVSLALIVSIIFSYLIFNKHPVFNKIGNNMLKYILIIIVYIISVTFFTIFISTIGLTVSFLFFGFPY